MNCRWIIAFIVLLIAKPVLAQMNDAQLTVWVNEAIVSTYTYNYSNVINRQKEIAKYFTASGWIAYNKALETSQLLNSVKKNKYAVSAVATMPPEIQKIGADEWKASMPLIVVYKNATYQQKQILKVIVNFSTASSGQGIRGLAITSFVSQSSEPPCSCTTP